MLEKNSGRLITFTSDDHKPALPEKKHDSWSDIAWWIQITSGMALLLMSLYQSGLYLAKYISHPTLTSITFQPLTVEDMPAVTICARPSYHPTKWAEFFKDDEYLFHAYTTSKSMELLAKKNSSYVDFMKQVAIPMVTTVTYCAVGSTDDDCDPYPGVWSALQDWQNESFTIPKEVPSAQWITRLIEENVGPFDDNFGLCATLVPNVTIKTGVQQQIIIDIDSGIPQPDSNKLTSWRWKDWLGSGYVSPQWNVYIHDRVDAVPAYALSNRMIPVKANHKTITRVGFSIDRYSWIPKKEEPCVEDPYYSPEKCRQACYEQYILPCTLPGVPQENTSQIILSPDNKLGLKPKGPGNYTPVCNMATNEAEAYVKAKDHLFSRNGSETFDAAMVECCPKKCRHYRYGTEILSETNMGVDSRKESYKAKLLIGILSEKLRSIDDQEAYTLDQLLGELGGAWGLFLGASLVNVIALLYEGFHRAFDYFSRERKG